MSCNDDNISKKVCIDYPLYQSDKGAYFIGQTPVLTGEHKHALGALLNPINSAKKIYVNSITITNISDLSLSAEFYLRARYVDGETSDLVSCTNTSIFPEPINSGQIIYLSGSSQSQYDGVPIFSRIVPPYSTLVVDGGQIILGSGQSIIIHLGGLFPVVLDSTKIAFGWWEEKNYDCSVYSYLR